MEKNNTLTNSKEALKYAIEHASYCFLCCMLGCIFSSCAQLGYDFVYTLRIYSPLFSSAAFISFAFALGFCVFEHGQEITRLYRLIAFLSVAAYLISVIISSIVLNKEFGISVEYLTSTVLYSALAFSCLHVIWNNERFGLVSRHATPSSIRYVIIIPAVFFYGLSLLYGSVIPFSALKFEYSYTPLIAAFLFVLGLYIIRGYPCKRHKKIIIAMVCIIIGLSILYFFVIYILGHNAGTLSGEYLKCMFLSFYVGLFLTLPDAYYHTWFCFSETGEQYSARYNFVDKLYCAINGLVYLTYWWFQLSRVYIYTYAIGSACVSAYITNKRETHHFRAYRAIFILVSITALCMEFSISFRVLLENHFSSSFKGVNQYACFILDFVSVFLIKLNVKDDHSLMSMLKEHTLKDYPSFCNRLVLIMIIQVLIILVSGGLYETSNAQTTLFASTLSIFTESVLISFTKKAEASSVQVNK